MDGRKWLGEEEAAVVEDCAASRASGADAVFHAIRLGLLRGGDHACGLLRAENGLAFVGPGKGNEVADGADVLVKFGDERLGCGGFAIGAEGVEIGLRGGLRLGSAGRRCNNILDLPD